MSADTASRTVPLAPARPAAAMLVCGVLAIVILGWFAFAPALGGTWVWDDHAEVLANPVIKDPAGWAKIWRGQETIDYFPLKTTLQWLQWHAWGDRSWPYHATNIALHLASALLIWRLLAKLGCAPLAAWLGGMVFAVHPLTVESVAWIAEFKNAVSLPPLLLATIAYVDFAERGRRRDYVSALLWFLAAALCKTSVVMLPLFLLLYHWWRGAGVTWRTVAALAPFFAVSVALGMVTIFFQQARAIGTWEIAAGGMGERVGRAAAALVFYLAKTISPVGLLPVYPRELPAETALAPIAAGLGLLGFGAWCWRRRSGWGRPALLAFGWFGLHLLPVAGLVSMAFMHFAWVADHFAYVPMVGVIGGAAAGWGGAWQRWPTARIGLAVVAAGVVAGAFLGTRSHAARYVSEETLWRYTLARNPAAWVGHNNLAVALAGRKKFAEAVEHLAQARTLKPDYPDVHVNAAKYLAHLGRFEEAQAAAARAETYRAATADMYSNLGSGLLAAGRVADALAAYERGLRLEPNHAPSHKAYGVALFLAGRADAAVPHYERGLRAAPDPDTHTNCGVALAALGRLPEAMRHYEAALQLAPDSVDAHYNLGIALARSGRPADAQAHIEAAIRSNPNHAEARYHLGEILLARGNRADAAAAYRAALRLRPELGEARRRLEELARPAGAAP